MGKLDFFSNISQNFTNNERNLSAKNCESIRMVSSPTEYGHSNIGSDHFIIVLNDQKPILSCFTGKINLSAFLCTVQMQLTNFRKHVIFIQMEKILLQLIFRQYFHSKRTATESFETQTIISAKINCNTDSC